MNYPERDMAGQQETGTLEEAAKKSIDPRVDKYTDEFYIRFAEEFPEFTTGQAHKAMQLSHEFALVRIAVEDSADTDQLTDLPNRKGFYKQFDRKLQQYHRDLTTSEEIDRVKASILYLDLDGFRLVNETYNHETGDQVLSAFGQLLKLVVRPTDIVGRIGGEEFVLLLDGSNLEESVKVAERVRIDATDLFNRLFPELEWPKTISIGIYQLPTMTLMQLASEESRLDSMEQFIHKADVAQYEGAKHAGKNRIGAMLTSGTVQTAIINTGTEGQPPTISYKDPEKPLL